MDDTGANFETLYRLWYAKMVLFAGTFAPLRADETEDLAHDALVHAWYRMDRYDPEKPFAPWLYRVARNFILDYLRRRPRTVSLEVPGEGGSEPPAPEPNPEELAVTRRMAALVDEAVARLDPSDLRIAMLVLRDGLTAREAGGALGMPAGTVRWRVSRIRATVRRAVDSRPRRGGKGEA